MWTKKQDYERKGIVFDTDIILYVSKELGVKETYIKQMYEFIVDEIERTSSNGDSIGFRIPYLGIMYLNYSSCITLGNRAVRSLNKELAESYIKKFNAMNNYMEYYTSIPLGKRGWYPSHFKKPRHFRVSFCNRMSLSKMADKQNRQQ